MSLFHPVELGDVVLHRSLVKKGTSFKTQSHIHPNSNLEYMLFLKKRNRWTLALSSLSEKLKPSFLCTISKWFIHGFARSSRSLALERQTATNKTSDGGKKSHTGRVERCWKSMPETTS